MEFYHGTVSNDKFPLDKLLRVVESIDPFKWKRLDDIEGLDTEAFYKKEKIMNTTIFFMIYKITTGFFRVKEIYGVGIFPKISKGEYRGAPNTDFPVVCYESKDKGLMGVVVKKIKQILREWGRVEEEEEIERDERANRAAKQALEKMLG